jgi:hypothetical protein
MNKRAAFQFGGQGEQQGQRHPKFFSGKLEATWLSLTEFSIQILPQIYL